MRDPQEDLNKRRSKAQLLLSTNQIIADDNAVDDWDELEDEAARPDGIIKKRRGSELKIERNLDLAEAHVKLMEQDALFMESTSGVTDENRGMETNAESGKAILARQNEGSTVTAPMFDNFRYTLQETGENELSLIEQYYDEPKVLRITNERGHAEFESINMMGADGQMNNITATQADFVVDTQDFRESMRIAMLERLTDALTKMPPALAVNLLDMVVDMMDVSGKDEMLRRIREFNGQPDPDAEDLEEQVEAARQQKAKQAQVAEAEQQADIDEKASKSENERADAAKKRTETMETAKDIALALAATPALANAVDTIFLAMQEEPGTEGPVPPMPQIPQLQNQMEGLPVQPPTFPTPDAGVSIP